MSNNKVLIVDNNPVFLSLMKGALVKHGYDVRAADNSLAALDILKTLRPAVIFIDLIMPDIDGAKLCKKIRDIVNLKKSRIILISAIAAEQELDYFSMGFDACIAKGPFDLMLPKIIRLLQQPDYKNKSVDKDGIFPREITKELLIIKKRLEVTLLNVSEAVLEITSNNRILYVNPAVIHIIGKSELELLGSDFLNLFKKKDRKRVRDAVYSDKPIQQNEDGDFLLWNNRKVSISTAVAGEVADKRIIVIKDVTEKRLAENELSVHTQFEKLITEISTQFINMPCDHIGKGIAAALKKIGAFAGVDRSYMFQFSGSGPQLTCSHEWCARGIEPQSDRAQKFLSDSAFPWFSKELKEQHIVHIPKVADLPEEAKAEKLAFQKQGILSMVNVAMLSENNIVGFIGFDTVRQEKTWSMEMISLLKIVGEIFINAINRSITEKALRESERKYRELADLLPQVVFETDTEGNLTFANRQALNYFGPAFHQREKVKIFEFIVEEDRSKTRTFFQKLLKGNALEPHQYSLIKQDGSIATMVIYANLIKHHNTIMGIRGVANDLTDRKRWEDLYRTLAEQSFAGVYLIVNGRFIYLNEKAAKNIGFEPHELIGKKAIEMIHPDDRKTAKTNAIEMLKGLRTAPYEHRIIMKDGRIRWQVETVSSIYYEGQRAVLGNVMDLTERKTTEEQLQYLSTHDSLTNLYNRAYFEAEVNRLEQGRRFPINVLMADIDFLKVTNDTLGHWAGDELLRRAASVLRQAFRKEDVIARIGGDEFAAIWADSGQESADMVLARIKKSLSNHNKHYPGTPLSLSSGVASGPRGCIVSKLMQEADKKMYEQKAITRRKAKGTQSTLEADSEQDLLAH